MRAVFNKAGREPRFDVFARGQGSDKPAVAQLPLAYLGDAIVQTYAFTGGRASEPWFNGREVLQQIGEFRPVSVEVLDEGCAYGTRLGVCGKKGVEGPEVGPD